ncbi:MAG TPA: DNA-directed RNA polymerase subunit omega [Candidatus Acidoferrales bacterium]|nr:DNA-directed RNA polymerase subunit omega [Candidatus Acidoferrales bacterium]
MIPLDKLDSKFAFVLAAAKRARQVQQGAKPLVHTTGHKSTRIAMEETFQGAVPFDLPSLEEEDEEGKKSKRRSK